jgi:thioredoxin-dependent peroxiredoxin
MKILNFNLIKLSVILLFFVSLFSSKIDASEWQDVPLVDFSLKDQTGQLRSSSEFKGRWLVLYFYPKDKTPGCTVEAQNFTQDYEKYKQLDTEIVGVSYDDVASHKDFSDTYDMPFALLADTDKQLAKALKVDRIFPWPHASRQTFIIDPKGVIKKHYADVSPKQHSNELLQALTELQQK